MQSRTPQQAQGALASLPTKELNAPKNESGA